MNAITWSTSGKTPATKLIVIYIEGVRDGKRFLEILRKTHLQETGYHP